MRKHFFNYYRPTDEEIRQLWSDGLFILDTNVIMKFYCYTDAARTDFLKALTLKAERLWLPNQVAFEYQKNRLIKIDEQTKAYEAIKKLLDEHLQFDKLPNPLDNYKYHPYIKKDEILARIDQIKTEIELIKKNLDETRKKHPNLINNDTIRDEITNLFDGRVGEPFNKDELEKIYTDGELRYKDNRPPGYKDKGKADSTLIIGNEENRLIIDKFGDLIIWSEIIKKAKKDKKSVIFVTDDSKEDWWLEFKGQKIGPRPELVHEFKSKTGMLYYMYSADKFLDYLKTNVGLEIKQETIDEVRNVTLFDEKRQIDVESLTAFLHAQFPDRIHAESKHVYELAHELLEENIKSINDLRDLLTLYPPTQYISPLEEESGGQLADVGVIRSLLMAKKIDEINEVINGWGPLPVEPKILRDNFPFVGPKSGIASYLMKSGNRLKIDATNLGELEISFSELGNRIGTGLPYLRRLMSRLGPFHDLLSKRFDESKMDGSKFA
jgi:hypothetical protein